MTFDETKKTIVPPVGAKVIAHAINPENGMEICIYRLNHFWDGKLYSIAKMCGEIFDSHYELPDCSHEPEEVIKEIGNSIRNAFIVKANEELAHDIFYHGGPN